MRTASRSCMVVVVDANRPRERMLAGVGARTRVLEVEGIATAVVEVGQGPPMLLLHGGIECGGAIWAPVLARLAHTNHMVVPDVPGLGESAPAPRLDVDTFGRWLRGVAEQTGLERPTLVAHSLLGSLAARLAARGTDVIGSLVLYAAPAVGPYRMPLRLRYVAARSAIRPTARNTERFNRFALLDLGATRRRDRDWYDAFVAYTRARASVPHVKKTMRQLIATQTEPIADTELDRITIPTTLLWGRHDRMVPLPVGIAAATRHRWPLHVIDHAAHAPHVEQPEAFLEALTSTVATPTFEATFADLLARWSDYQLVPRSPDHVSELGAARWRLEQARSQIRHARLRLRRPFAGAEPGPPGGSPPEIAAVQVRAMISN